MVPDERPDELPCPALPCPAVPCRALPCLVLEQPNAMSSSSLVKGKFVMRGLPGSPVVLDRNSWELKECTPQLCPYAQPYTDKVLD